MDSGIKKKSLLVGLILVAIVGPLSRGIAARADDAERTNVIVIVKDAETGEPINQARLTLHFSEGGGPLRFGRDKKFSFSAKTNASGRYKFTGIPKGTILLQVTADRRKAEGKEFEIEQDDQVIEIKLKKPRPLL
jgi:hypothetical protein